MPPTLTSRVPSRTLLRFLKSQSDAAFSIHGSPCSPAADDTIVCRRARVTYFLNEVNTRFFTTTIRPTRSSVAARHQPKRVGTLSNKPLRYKFCTTTATRKLFEPKSSNEPTWQERVWGTSAKKGAKPLKPDDLPAHDDFDHGSSMFTSRRVLSAKAALEPRLRCTEVDEHGKVILVDGEFKKTELIAKVRCVAPFFLRQSHLYTSIPYTALLDSSV